MHRYEKEFDEALRAQIGRRRGCWGLRKKEREFEGPLFILDHIPSGTRAGQSTEEGVMERFADMLDGLGDFSNGKPDLADGETWREKLTAAAEIAGLIHIGASSWLALHDFHRP